MFKVVFGLDLKVVVKGGLRLEGHGQIVDEFLKVRVVFLYNVKVMVRFGSNLEVKVGCWMNFYRSGLHLGKK